MRILSIVLVVIGVAAGAEAQVIGYGVGGMGRVSRFVSEPTFSAAAGAEVFAGDRFTIGGEVGVLDSLIVGSANASVHFGSLRKAVVLPFLTGGYSQIGVLYGDGNFSAFNVGAGIHVWRTDRAGFRVELRDHIRPDDRGTVHYWSARIGLSFR